MITSMSSHREIVGSRHGHGASRFAVEESSGGLRPDFMTKFCIVIVTSHGSTPNRVYTNVYSTLLQYPAE